jgi:hypothetical protein
MKAFLIRVDGERYWVGSETSDGARRLVERDLAEAGFSNDEVTRKMTCVSPLEIDGTKVPVLDEDGRHQVSTVAKEIDTYGEHIVGCSGWE